MLKFWMVNLVDENGVTILNQSYITHRNAEKKMNEWIELINNDSNYRDCRIYICGETLWL